MSIYTNRSGYLGDLVVGDICNYSYNGSYYSIKLPPGTYKINCWGAQGGTGYSAYQGGFGARTQGTLIVRKRQTLYLYCGESPVDVTKRITYNGGGAQARDGSERCNGGGATDIRLVNGSWNDIRSLCSRVMVASGGGGGNHSGDNAYITGAGLSNLFISPNGIYTNLSSSYTAGSFGTGASAAPSGAYPNGGGGGGYYGGVAKSIGNTYVGCSGGTSFISGHSGCDAIASQESDIFRIKHTGRSIHYSGIAFTNTEIYPNSNDGNGRITITLQDTLLPSNYQHFYIECEDKKYIPTKDYWSDNLNGFVPIEDFVIKDINNPSRTFINDIQDLLKPIDIGVKSIIPIDLFKNKNFRICKFIGFCKTFYDDNKDNTNKLISNINISLNYKESLYQILYIKLLEYVSNLDFVKYKYKLKLNCHKVKIALFNKGEYYGNDFKVIPKDDIINSGFDFTKLNDIDIPFTNFKIVAALTGYEELENIKLFKKLKPVSKKVNSKYYEVNYDTENNKIYLKIHSFKTSRLVVNKLSKHKNTYGITNSLDDIKE